MSRDPNEPLLSSEETDALLEAMRAGGALQPDADPVDLTAPDRPLRDAVSRADRVAQTFAKELRKAMLRSLGWSVIVEPIPTEITPFSVLTTSLPHGTAVGILGTIGGNGGMLIMGPTISSFVLDRLLGAPVSTEEITPSVRGDLTALDRCVIQPFMEALAELFDHIWSEVENALKLDSVLARPSDATARTQFEPMLRIGLRLTAPGSDADELVVALNGSAVLATVPRAPEEPPVRATATDRGRMARRVVGTPVRAVAILGKTRSNIREILSLKEGDVVRLDSVPNEPVEVRSGGILVLRGMPVVHHGNLAVEVTETLSKGTKHDGRPVLSR